MIADLKPYPTYRPSGIKWHRSIPAHWRIERGKWLFKKMKRPVRETDEVVTCFRDGVVTLRKNRRTEGFTESLQEIGYQGIRSGDLVIHAMDAFAGAIGVSDSDGKGTPVYSVCSTGSHANAFYYSHTLREMARSQWIAALATGIRERSTDFRYTTLAVQELPLPPLAEQDAIARYLAHVDRRIQRYIEAKEKLISLLEEKRKVATQEAMQSSDATSQRLKAVAEIVERPVKRVSDETYTPVGLYNRGRGVFRKEPRSGNDLGDSDFFWIEEGDLVISGQFAWEGAIALASDVEHGCVASHRFPILRGKSGISNSRFLLAFFKTDWGQFILDQNSRGAAGRNRPLNVRTLMKEKISLPPIKDQMRIAEMLQLESHVRQQARLSEQLLNEFRASLIAHVVTGKLDMRAAAAQLPQRAPEQEAAVR